MSTLCARPSDTKCASSGTNALSEVGCPHCVPDRATRSARALAPTSCRKSDVHIVCQTERHEVRELWRQRFAGCPEVHLEGQTAVTSVAGLRRLRGSELRSVPNTWSEVGCLRRFLSPRAPGSRRRRLAVAGWQVRGVSPISVAARSTARRLTRRNSLPQRGRVDQNIEIRSIRSHFSNARNRATFRRNGCPA